MQFALHQQCASGIASTSSPSPSASQWRLASSLPRHKSEGLSKHRDQAHIAPRPSTLYPPVLHSSELNSQPRSRTQCSSSGSASSSRAPSSSSPLLEVMTNTRPVDRLRYQAKFVFNAFDKGRTGVDTLCHCPKCIASCTGDKRTTPLYLLLPIVCM